MTTNPRETTLAELFPLDGKSLAMSLRSAPPPSEAQARVAAATLCRTLTRWPTLSAQLASQLCTLLDVSFPDILFGAWADFQEVRTQVRLTAADPALHWDVALASHSFIWRTSPSMDLLENGVLLCRIPFDLSLTCTVDAAIVALRSGCVESIRTGRARCELTIACLEQPVWSHTLPSVDLPGVHLAKPPRPLPGVAPPSPANAAAAVPVSPPPAQTARKASMPPFVPIARQFAERAAEIVSSLQETAYEHTTEIDSSTGVYLCDCSGFVSYVVGTLAPRHYALIPAEPSEDRPRAFMYYNFLSTLDPAQTSWTRIARLADALPGDVLAWRFPEIVPGHDTGHVLFVASAPTPAEQPATFNVQVYDSANVPHFDDTRGSEPNRFPNGVGSGTVQFQVDASGAPTAFLFAPGDHFVPLPIAIGRAGPIS